MSWSFDCSSILNDIDNTALLNNAGEKFVVKKTAEFVRDYIQDQWPIDTALSFASFSVNNGEVRNSTDYAIYVHNGLIQELAQEGLNQAKQYAQDVANQFISQKLKGSPLIDPRSEQRTDSEVQNIVEKANPLPELPTAGPLQFALGLAKLTMTQKVSASTVAIKLFQEDRISEFEKNQINKGVIQKTIKRLLRKGKQAEARELSEALKP